MKQNKPQVYIILYLLALILLIKGYSSIVFQLIQLRITGVAFALAITEMLMITIVTIITIIVIGGQVIKFIKEKKNNENF